MINFRFINKAQLRQLYDAFQFPAKVTYKPSGNTFSGEEVFLAGLFRIHGPVTQLDNFYAFTFGCDTPSLLEWMQYGPRGKPRSYFQNIEVNVDAWLSEEVDINAMERAAAEAQEAVAEEDTFEEFE